VAHAIFGDRDISWRLHDLVFFAAHYRYPWKVLSCGAESSRTVVSLRE